MTIFLSMILPLLKAFWKPIALILAVLAIYLYGAHSGRMKERGIWVAKIESERRAQTIITNAHESLAIKEVEQLNDDIEKQEKLIQELRAQAAASPDAGKPALGIDGIKRVNRGR
jgi:hypothetical protein